MHVAKNLQAREAIIVKIRNAIEAWRHRAGSASGYGVLERLMEEESLPDEAVVADFIINLLFAGNETTAKTMVFAVYFLTHSPRALQQVLVRLIYVLLVD